MACRNASAVPTTSNIFLRNVPASPLLSHPARTSPAECVLLRPSLRIMSSAELDKIIMRVFGEVRSAKGWQSCVPGRPGVLSPGTREILSISGLLKVLKATGDSSGVISSDHERFPGPCDVPLSHLFSSTFPNVSGHVLNNLFFTCILKVMDYHPQGRVGVGREGGDCNIQQPHFASIHGCIQLSTGICRVPPCPGLSPVLPSAEQRRGILKPDILQKVNL